MHYINEQWSVSSAHTWHLIVFSWKLISFIFNHGDEIRLSTDDTTRNPRAEMQEAGIDNTCGIRDHSHHRTAADPNIMSQNRLITIHLMMNLVFIILLDWMLFFFLLLIRLLIGKYSRHYLMYHIWSNICTRYTATCTCVQKRSCLQ